ncbi:MAG: hemerythrin domain-containing protein [Magnetococcales bacterium]|nr:hemerythrin domain-containing protein [Magnetococcales bacterium]
MQLCRRDVAGGPRAIQEYFIRDHRRCDDLFATMEEAAQQGDLERTRQWMARFQVGMLHHFRMEEEVFFPAFESRTGMRQGPTMVMRMEHEQMRGLMAQMAQSLESGQLDGVKRAFSTLLMIMQQHNLKEEQMLYPMGDAHLRGEADEVVKNSMAL